MLTGGDIGHHRLRQSLPATDQAFKIETHGIDHIPLSERWAKPRDVGAMWAGASVQIEYFIYGAVLMTFGFNFAQALSLIIIGNLSYFLLGLCSLQAPQTGTTVFAINRASYGPNGSRLISFFNWLTQIGFEVEGLILIVGAALVLQIKAGFCRGDAGQGDLRHRGRAHPGRAPLPRPRHDLEDAAGRWSSRSSSSSRSCSASPSRMPPPTGSPTGPAGRSTWRAWPS